MLHPHPRPRQGLTLVELIGWLTVSALVVATASMLLISSVRTTALAVDTHRSAVERQVTARILRDDVSGAADITVDTAGCQLDGGTHLLSVSRPDLTITYLIRDADGSTELLRRTCLDGDTDTDDGLDTVLARQLDTVESRCLTSSCNEVEVTVHGTGRDGTHTFTAARRVSP